MSTTMYYEAILAAASTLALFALIWWILQIIAYWKIFTKAGEAGWKSIIPFYSNYIQFKIAWKTSVFWILILLAVLSTIFTAIGLGFISGLLSIAELVIGIIFFNKMSKAFGKGVGFTLGLIFLNPIFVLILGFGSAEYQGADL